MFCNKCGSAIDPNSNFCRQCGTALPSELPVAKTPHSNDPEPSTVTPPLPQPESVALNEQKSGEKLTTPKKPTTTRQKVFRVLGAFVVIVVFLSSAAGSKLLVGLLGSGFGDGSVTDRAKAMVSDATPKEYVAADYGFKLNFPGFPVIAHKTQPVGQYTIPYTSYSRESNGGETVTYAVVYDYRSMSAQEADLSLEGALNGMVQNIAGAKLVSTTAASLGGRDGLEGYFTAPVPDKTYDSYARFTKKGAFLYGVWTIGAPRADFDALAQSFQFTN